MLCKGMFIKFIFVSCFVAEAVKFCKYLDSLYVYALNHNLINFHVNVLFFGIRYFCAEPKGDRVGWEGTVRH